MGLREALRRYEAELIVEALRQTGGVRAEAARRLDLPVRTLSHKMQVLGIRTAGYAVDPDPKDRE